MNKIDGELIKVQIKRELKLEKFTKFSRGFFKQKKPLQSCNGFFLTILLQS
jgi:hypothetical protein